MLNRLWCSVAACAPSGPLDEATGEAGMLLTRHASVVMLPAADLRRSFYGSSVAQIPYALLSFRERTLRRKREAAGQRVVGATRRRCGLRQDLGIVAVLSPSFCLTKYSSGRPSGHLLRAGGSRRPRWSVRLSQCAPVSPSVPMTTVLEAGVSLSPICRAISTTSVYLYSSSRLWSV
jgi:hypothetical protein